MIVSVKIAIDCHTVASKLRRVYGSTYGQTRFQSFLRGFTPMFVVVCAAYVVKLFQ